MQAPGAAVQLAAQVLLLLLLACPAAAAVSSRQDSRTSGRLQRPFDSAAASSCWRCCCCCCCVVLDLRPPSPAAAATAAGPAAPITATICSTRLLQSSGQILAETLPVIGIPALAYCCYCHCCCCCLSLVAEPGQLTDPAAPVSASLGTSAFIAAARICLLKLPHENGIRYMLQVLQSLPHLRRAPSELRCCALIPSFLLNPRQNQLEGWAQGSVGAGLAASSGARSCASNAVAASAAWKMTRQHLPVVLISGQRRCNPHLAHRQLQLCRVQPPWRLSDSGDRSTQRSVGVRCQQKHIQQALWDRRCQLRRPASPSLPQCGPQSSCLRQVILQSILQPVVQGCILLPPPPAAAAAAAACATLQG